MKTIPSSDLPVLRPKCLLFGPTGSTKTRTLLQLPGRKLMIDGEKGSLAYAGQHDFDVPLGPNGAAWSSDSPMDLEALVDDLLKDPGDYTVLMIDPISVFLTRLRDMADAAKRPGRVAKSGGRMTDFDSAMDVGAHTRIAQIFRRIFSKLRRLDMAVMVTARERTILEQIGESFRPGGQAPEGPKDMEYEFDTVIQLGKSGNTPTAIVRKIRGRPAPTAEINPWPGGSWLVDQFGVEAFTRRATPRPLLSEAQEKEIDDLARLLEVSTSTMAASLSRRGANSVGELAPDAAEEMLVAMRERWKAKCSPGPTAQAAVAAAASPATAETNGRVVTSENAEAKTAEVQGAAS